MANNPLIDRYYSPLGLELKADPEVAAQRDLAIADVQARLERARTESEKQDLRDTLRKMLATRRRGTR